MCNASCVIFGATQLSRAQVEGRKVLEVGSLDVNGSLRPIVELWNPAEYLGVDVEEGPGVDLICSAERIVDVFGRESFDIVISTELLEHVRDWRKVISNVKHVCRRNGIILITTRSCGFAYHGYPSDFWRFELADIRGMFSDCRLDALETDRSAPGVLVKATKPEDFVEKDLADYEVYSILVHRRVKELNEDILRAFRRRFQRGLFFRRLEKGLKRFLASSRRFLLSRR
jgi:SAM-dependent methyltransferase